VPPQEHPSLGTDQQFAVLRTWVKDPGAIVVVNPERLELEALLAQQNPRHPQVILATSFDKRDNPVEQVRKLVRRLRINGAIDDGLDRNIVSWCDRLDLHALTGGGQRVGDLLGQATIEAISADPSRVAPPVGALPAVFFQFFSEQDSAVARLVQVLALRTAAIHRIIARANPGDATLIRLWEALLNTTASYRLECARRLLDANLDEMWSEQTAKILAGSMRGPDRIVAHQHLLACHLAGRDWPTIAAALDKALRDGIAISLGDGIDDLPWGTLQRERLPLTEAVENLTSAFVERRDHPTTPLDDAAAGRLVSTLVGCRNALSFDRDAFPVMTSIEADGVTRAEFATQVGDGRLNGSHWPLLLVGKGSLSERGEYLQKAAVLTVFSAQARTLPELRKWFRHAPTNEKDWLELHGAMASGDAAAAEKLLRSLAPQGKPVTSSMVDQYQWEAPIRRWLNLFAWLAGREARKPIPYPALPPGRDPGRAQAAECMAKVVTAVNERRFADAQQLVTGFLDTLTGTQLLHSHDALDLLFLARSGVIIQRAAQDAREAQRRKLEEQRAEDTKNDKKPGKKK
jgi:hypothetical protein